MSELYTTPGIVLCVKLPETEQKVGSLILSSSRNTPLLQPIVLPGDLKLDLKLTDHLLVGGSMPVVVQGKDYQLVKVEQILLVIRD